MSHQKRFHRIHIVENYSIRQFNQEGDCLKQYILSQAFNQLCEYIQEDYNYTINYKLYVVSLEAKRIEVHCSIVSYKHCK